MRYYKIVISAPPGSTASTSGTATNGEVIVSAGAPSKGPVTFSSVLANGSNDPGALNIELDLSVAGFAEPLGPAATFLRIWGPSVKQIGQQNDLNGKEIAIYGGMSRGLPLATIQQPQAGLLATGTIFQAFANWVGVDMTLDMVLQAPIGATANPLNLSMNWVAGTKLSQAIATTLSTAYPPPKFKQSIQISDRIVASVDQPGAYATLPQFAQWIKRRSKAVVGGDYPGVTIMLRDSTFFVFDGTSQTAPKQIVFTDLIGQPTWQDAPIIQLIVVMRSDISVGDFIKLPTGILTTASAQNLASRDSVTFNGVFQVTQLRHVGNFRQASAEAWVTVINAAPQNVAA